MTTVIVILLLVLVIALGVAYARSSARTKQAGLADAKAEARRWVERLGGQVMNLSGNDDASKQALADAAERYTAAGSQLDQTKTSRQANLATQTALEGLYYVRAARTAMGMDPGPELPDLGGQSQAGRVTEDRKVTVSGQQYEVSPEPGSDTPHYYPGGMISGRPVPQGWYSTPWWKTALTGAAAGVGGFLIADALFGGMGGFGGGYGSGFDGGSPDAQAADFGGFDGGGFDSSGDFGGFDNSGDFGGF